MTRFSRIRSTDVRASGHRAAIASLSLAAVGLVAVPVASAVTPTTDPPPSRASATATTARTGSNRGETGSSAKLEKARQRCLSALERRQATVRDDLAAVRDATGAPAADRNELTGQLEGVATDLAAARSTIEAADTAAALRSACTNMVSSTRVFRLYGPKTRALVTTSRLHALDSRLDANEGRIEQAITRAGERGVPAEKIAAAKGALADITTRIGDLHAEIDPLDGQLLPLTVAQVNDSSAEATLSAARTALHDAREHVAAIRADLRAIRSDLGGH